MINKFIPLSVPNLKGNELVYITNAVKTEWVSTGGPYVTEFEEKISKYVGAQGAVSCQNGTAGLHIALTLCGVNNKHEVIVPALTFIAAVNPVKYCGAEPIFMDCDDSLGIDPIKLEEFIEQYCTFENGQLINTSSSKIISTIIVVHVFGNFADMEKIMKIAKKYNLKVIEDSTEALGTYFTSGVYKGKFAGTIGDIGVYSFNGNKIITTGGGGMIVSNNLDYLKHAKHLTTQAKSDELFYRHDEIGYNYRMTNLQAAMGLAQLEQLEDFIKIKKQNYNLYKEILSSVPGMKIIEFRNNTRPNYWFYGLQFNDKYPLSRNEIIEYLQKNSIQSRPIWGLINQQIPYISNLSYKIENAQNYIDSVVNVPCSTNLKRDDIIRIANTLINAKK